MFCGIFMCSRGFKAIHRRLLQNLSDRALEAGIRVKLGKALPVLILRLARVSDPDLVDSSSSNGDAGASKKVS